nr:hypothetical protein Iba_chr06bCG0650 [Ipomoea batatas]
MSRGKNFLIKVLTLKILLPLLGDTPLGLQLASSSATGYNQTSQPTAQIPP